MAIFDVHLVLVDTLILMFFVVMVVVSAVCSLLLWRHRRSAMLDLCWQVREAQREYEQLAQDNERTPE